MEIILISAFFTILLILNVHEIFVIGRDAAHN